MKYLLFFNANRSGEAAKTFAGPLRHRRHRVYLRDLAAWRASGAEVEPCDGLILMFGEDEDAPALAELEKAYKGTDQIHVAPGDDVWPPSEDEAKAMNSLNQLRHDAALLGIEVDPAFDEERLVKLIRSAEGRERDQAQADEEAAQKIEREVEAARNAREGGAGTDAGAGLPPPPAAEGAGAPAGDGNTSAATPAPDPLEGVDTGDVKALREFAKTNNIPVSPNPKTGAAKLLASIRLVLGKGE